MIIEGKVENMNIGQDFFNCNVVTAKKEYYNIKLNKEQANEIRPERVYVFEVEIQIANDKTLYFLKEYRDLLDEIEDPVLLKEKLSAYYEFSSEPVEVLQKEIEKYLDSIKNKIIKEITLALYEKYKKSFYLYPAAVRFHHAYIGGLSHHTKTMLDLANAVMKVYPFINKDLVYSGVILHDLCKVDELSAYAGGEYTKKGQLVGHLVMISQEMLLLASKLGYEKSEEVLMLNHILLSHHGIPNFGAAKRPQTAEALLVWYVDTIDSKFAVLGQTLSEIEEGTFTQPIAVLDKQKYYKHKVK